MNRYTASDPSSNVQKEALLGNCGCITYTLEQAGLFEKDDAKKWLNASLQIHFERQPMSVQFGPTCDGYGKPNKT